MNATVEFTPTTGVETYLGYDMQKYWGRDDVLIIADKTELTQAVFGQVRLTPDLIPHTHLAAGLRYNAPDAGDSATVWNVSGQYDFTDSLFVRARVGTSVPPTSTPSRCSPMTRCSTIEVGNPNLKAGERH